MFRNKKLLRVIAIFLLLNTINFTFAPSISYALTAGPTAPEYSSFEPVDTTDMVNLATGDFTYNIPLLEVPGPEGGYPLSLSYHAGITPDQEASWVGLGWTLNAGAINRFVSGYPDDHDGAEQTVRDYWEGGSRHSFSVGYGLPVGPGVDLDFAWDTYQGFGVGVAFNYTFGISDVVGLEGGIGVGPYGGAYGGVSVSLSKVIEINEGVEKVAKEIFGLSGSIGLQTNFNTISVSGGLSAGNSAFSLGTSISSQGIKPYGTISGISIGQINNHAGKITTESKSYSIPFGLLRLGYKYTRYYSDETSDVNTYGSFHREWGTSADNISFDSHALIDLEDEGLVSEQEADKSMGGSVALPDYYAITGQGVGGAIKPYSFTNGSLYRQNLKDNDGNPIITYKNKMQPPWVASFRTVGDFANRYYFDDENTSNVFDDPYISSNTASGLGFVNDYNYMSDDFNYTTQYLEGSQHIEHFTYEEEPPSGFMQAPGYFELPTTNKSVEHIFYLDTDNNWNLGGFNISKQIKGIMVTNKSGVTYHYSIPVYAHSEYSYYQDKDDQGSDIWRKQSHPHPYAYTWLLTGITGPDFLDIGDDPGIIDENDKGYWVKFNYGKWTDNFAWQNPAVGKKYDIDGKEVYSHGLKEIYYLNSIQTRSHTAFFIKSHRRDAKSSNLSDGGFGVSDNLNNCSPFYFPFSSLKLDEIILINQESINELSDEYNTNDLLYYLSSHNSPASEYVNITCDDPTALPSVGTFHSNRLIIKEQISDILNDLYEKASRTIQFDYSYELCPETPNSFDIVYHEDGTKPTIANNDPSGKLTLKSLEIFGKNRAKAIPSTIFDYDTEAFTDNFIIDSEETITDGGIEIARYIYFDKQGETQFEEGDLMKFALSDKDHYGTILEKTYDGSRTLIKLLLTGQWNLVSSYINAFVLCTSTKNPPYREDFKDIWGFYKSDYNSTTSKNLSRFVTKNSSKSLDAWLLNRITFPLGSELKIKFSSDQYGNVELNRKNSIIIDKPEEDVFYDPNETSIKLFVNSGNESLFDLFILNDIVDIYAIYKVMACAGLDEYGYPTNCGTASNNANKYEGRIEEIGEDYLVIDCEPLYDELYEYYDPVYGYFEYAGGNISLSKNKNLGGGIRVDEMELRDLFKGVNRFTKYSYTKYYTEESSGSLPYEPIGFEDYKTYGIEGENEILEKHVKNLYSSMNYMIANKSILPNPEVIYTRVQVQDEIQKPGMSVPIKSNASKLYEFYPFEKNMVERKVIHEAGTEIWPAKTIRFRDLTSHMGQLKSVSTLDANGNVLTKTTNQYLYDIVKASNPTELNDAYKEELINRFRGQGIVTELFHEFREVKKDDGNIYRQAVMAVKEEIPAILVKTIEEDFRKGLKSEAEYLSFDPFSGEATKVLTTDSQGDKYITYNIPAYRMPNHVGMGIKEANSNNRHMLTQEGISVSAKVDNSLNPVGILSANMQTWTNKWSYWEDADDDGIYLRTAVVDDNTNTWRRHKTYSARDMEVQEDGTARLWIDAENGSLSDPSYMYSKLSVDEYLTSESTLFDHFSHVLEGKDINGIYSSIKMDVKHSKVISSITNSRYDEFAYSGAEDELVNGYDGGGVVIDGQKTAGYGHTGNHFVLSNSGQRGFIFDADNLSAKRYVLSVWSDRNDISLNYKVDNGSAQSVTNVKINLVSDGDDGGWYLHEGMIELNTISDLEVWCEANGVTLFDDFRFHPYDAAMTSYVYNEWGELWAILDNQNMATFYEYDEMGRLKSVHRETFKYGKVKVSENEINYARMND